MGKETWARELGKTHSPGPADYSKQTRAGRGAPAYSIKSKYPEKGPPYAQPYVQLPTTIGETPMYTIRPATREPAPFDTPGPSYVPPRFGEGYLRRSNGTMRMRSLSLEARNPKYEKYDHDPFGPGSRDTRYHANDSRAPAYRIGEDNGSKWLKTNDNPGAATYSPNTDYVMTSNPKYSIYSKPVDIADDDTPGPGNYDTKDEFGKRPLAVRPRTVDIAGFQTPGPGRYDQPAYVGKDTPQTAIRPLCGPKDDQHGVQYRKIPRVFDSVNGLTIGPKTKPLEPFKTPGPGDYSPRRSWNSSGGHTMSPKGGREQLFGSWLDGWRSPGPAEYKASDKTARAHSPEFSLRDNVGPRFVSPSDTPGPSDYTPDKEPTRQRSPRFTIRPRCGNDEQPSPTKDAGYVALKDIPHSTHAFTIRPREELDLIPK